MLGYYDNLQIVRSPNVLNIKRISTKYESYQKLTMSMRVKSYLAKLSPSLKQVIEYIYRSAAVIDFGRDTNKYPLASYYNIATDEYLVNLGYFHRPLYDIPFRDILSAFVMTSCCKFQPKNILAASYAQFLQGIIVKVFGNRYGILSHTDVIGKVYDVCFEYVTNHSPCRALIQALSKLMPGFSISVFITSLARILSITALPLFESYCRMLGTMIAGTFPNSLVPYIAKYNLSASNILYKQALSLFHV